MWYAILFFLYMVYDMLCGGLYILRNVLYEECVGKGMVYTLCDLKYWKEICYIYMEDIR